MFLNNVYIQKPPHHTDFINYNILYIPLIKLNDKDGYKIICYSVLKNSFKIMTYMKRNYQHSKWTSINKVKGWRHFEIINVNKKTNELELFSVCKKKIKVTVSEAELEDRNQWLPSWRILEAVNDK